MNRRKILQNCIGCAALLLLIALFCLVYFGSEEEPGEKKQETDSQAGAKLYFDTEELCFDGTGVLNLMEGVHAVAADGRDLTDQVTATITADGTVRRKIVRYTLLDEKGRQISKKRTLVMKQYSGPVLEVETPLHLKAEDLNDLINVLHESSALNASDGYGADITGQVTCLREHQTGTEYRMVFRIVNSYLDEQVKTVTAYIIGEVKDPVIQLRQSELVLPQNAAFDPLYYVAFADDGFGNPSYDQIRIESSVNTAVPGNYRIVYQLYSGDRTAVTTEVLMVTVRAGEGND